MANIGLCAKVCWFIAQIVLLQLVHHHQSANAVDFLEVHIDPPKFNYAVEVTTDDGRKITEGPLYTVIGQCKEDGKKRQMILLDKSKLKDVNKVIFTISHPEGKKSAVAEVPGKEAYEEVEYYGFNYFIRGGA